MDVQQFNILLEKLATGEITTEELSSLASLAQTKNEWRESYEAVKKMVEILKTPTSEMVSPPADFESSLLHKLEEAKTESHTNKKVFGGLIAIAASFILFLFLYHPPEVISPRPEKKILISKSVTTPGEPVTITIDYTAPDDIENVKIVIALNDNTSFVSSSPQIRQKRTIVWVGTLHKGSNAIPFTVQAPLKGHATISTTALYNGIEHPHLIVLDSDGTRVTILQYRLFTQVKEDA